MDRSIAPEIKIIDKIDIQEAQEYTLDNGIKVYAIDAGSQDIMRTDFVFDAGVYEQEKFFQAGLTNSLMREGTENHSAQEIAEKLDFWGSFLHLDLDKHIASLSFYSLHKFYPETLKLVEEIIKKPKYYESEFKIKLEQRRQKFKLRKEKVEILAIEKYFESLFGSNHPYGNRAELEDFDKIKIEDLIQFHKTHYHAGNVYILMAGKNPEQFIKLLNQKFGQKDWYKEKENKKTNFRMQESPGGEHYIEKENSQQSAIRAGMQLFPESQEEMYHILILNTILGGYFGSRLMQNLREDKGYTYGISSMIREERQAKMLLIVADVGVEYTRKSIEEIKKEIIILTKEKISIEELELAKRQMLGDILELFDGPFALIDAYQSLHELNRDYSYFQNLIKTIKTTEPSDLLKIAQKHLILDNIKFVIAGQLDN